MDLPVSARPAVSSVWRSCLRAVALAVAMVGAQVPTVAAAPGAGADAAAPQTPSAWLAAMDDAFRTQSYDGVFSYFNGTDLASLRVVHRVIDGEQRERLVHLNGVPREFVRKGEAVACLLMPGDKLIELEDNMPSGPFARGFTWRFDNVSENYMLSTFGEGRIADRTAVRLAITPKDSDRYGYRIWIDRETKLLLRSELVDADGHRLEIFQFNRLVLGDDVDEAALEPKPRDGTLVNHLTLADRAPEPRPVGNDKWRVGWLPSGFHMAGSDARRKSSNLKPVDMLMYSDGIAAFSVFIESLPEGGGVSMVSRNGATVAVTHTLRGDADHLVTVVGELPSQTAQRIARSVSYVE